MNHRDSHCDWVVVQRLVTGQPLGERAPTWTEGLHAARELIRRGQPCNRVVVALGLNGQNARELVREAKTVHRGAA